MDDIKVTLGHVPKEKSNYLKLAECFSLAANRLKEYTEYFLSKMHTRIKEKLSGLPICTKKCSQRFGRENMWCVTCQHWKRELIGSFRHKFKLNTINWRKIKSWKWPEKSEWIFPIFLNNINVKKVEEIDLNDLATALSIWDNCNEYRISQNLIRKLRKNRNKYLAHNSGLKVSDSKLKNVCCVLNTLFVELNMDTLVPAQIRVQICEWRTELFEIKTRKLYEEILLEKVDIIDQKASIALSNHEDVKHIVTDLDKKADTALAQNTEVKSLISTLDTKTERSLSNEEELLEQVNKIDDKVDIALSDNSEVKSVLTHLDNAGEQTFNIVDNIDRKTESILSNTRNVNDLLTNVDKKEEELLCKVVSIDKKLQEKPELKETTELQHVQEDKTRFLTFRRLIQKYPMLISGVTFVIIILGINYLCPDNVATCLRLAPNSADTRKRQTNFPLSIGAMPSKEDRLSALAADYMCYHYTQNELELIRNGTLPEAVVCEHIAHQIYATGDVKCGVCKCCQFIPPEYECYHYSLVEKLQIRYTPEKDVCEQIPGRIFTQGNGVCGICWCCKVKLKPYVCYHYTPEERLVINLNLSLEKEICLSVPTRLYTEGDGTCGGCWCCQERENLAILQKAINQIK